MTIYKFPIPIQDTFTVPLPDDAVVVHAGLDPQGVPCLWARLDPNAPRTDRVFHLRGTGHPVPDDLHHIASFVNGPFVWHLFE
jgi:hypothetical protein